MAVCHSWITYRGTCRVILVMTDHVELSLMHNYGVCNKQTCTANARVTETHAMNTCMAQTHIQFTQMTNPASTQAT